MKQWLSPVDKNRKAPLLIKLIKENDWQQLIVFTRTKHGANRLAKQLEAKGITAAAIHGNKSQGARTRALANFKAGEVRTLVATDIAARGLDIEQLPQVVNYDLPNVAEDYVHRIGRTGRAGASGEAVSLVCAEELDQLTGIESLIGKLIERVSVEGFEPSEPLPEKPLKALKKKKPKSLSNGQVVNASPVSTRTVSVRRIMREAINLQVRINDTAAIARLKVIAGAKPVQGKSVMVRLQIRPNLQTVAVVQGLSRLQTVTGLSRGRRQIPTVVPVVRLRVINAVTISPLHSARQVMRPVNVLRPETGLFKR